MGVGADTAFRELRVVVGKEIPGLWALGDGDRCVADPTRADRNTIRR
jgi:hypothetical protein